MRTYEEVWQARTQRGHRAIELHPDFKVSDPETAATDVIADILHALIECESPEGADAFDARAVLDRAWRTFEGDLEDPRTGEQ